MKLVRLMVELPAHCPSAPHKAHSRAYAAQECLAPVPLPGLHSPKLA